jgi:hypothetical protein
LGFACWFGRSYLNPNFPAAVQVQPAVHLALLRHEDERKSEASDEHNQNQEGDRDDTYHRHRLQPDYSGSAILSVPLFFVLVTDLLVESITWLRGRSNHIVVIIGNSASATD